MEKPSAILCFLVAIGVSLLAFPEGFTAVLVASVVAGVTIALIRKNTAEPEFLIRIFLIALLVRIIFGTFVHVFDLRGFFGGDAITYDLLGVRLTEIWFEQSPVNDPLSQRAMNMSSGWGMNYLTAIIYLFTGRNILAAQFFVATVGAAIAPLVYSCAYKIFNNKRVGRISALFVALFPAFIIWTSQLLKDGLIVFLLVLTMIMVLQLHERFNYVSVGLLIFSLFSIISLRFYIFYMVAIAVAGSFVLGVNNTAKSLLTRAAVLLIIGVSLTYLGVTRNASQEIENFGNLERLQQSRQDLAQSADSGFGEDIDVSTTEGAISAIPIGFAYLMLAPFPWQLGSLRQSFTLPEILVWWALMPFLIGGIWYTVKNKLRTAFPVLLFTLMLTVAYSIFSGNVGTAYRQRTQIQVFLFIFIAVGWTLFKERRENQRITRQPR